MISALKRRGGNTEGGSSRLAPRSRWTPIRSPAAVMLLAISLSVSAEAREVAGVKFDETARLAGIDTPLVLNGAGVRSKFFVKVYVAGLYLQQKTNSAETVLASPGAKRVHMHFVHSQVSAKKLRAAWSDGYRTNHPTKSSRDLPSGLNGSTAFSPTSKRVTW